MPRPAESTCPADSECDISSCPQLFSQKGMVTDDPAGETYWKVKNGIRLTAMPSFKDMLSDDQMWKIAAVVSRADKLPAEAQDALKPPAECRLPAASPAACGHAQRAEVDQKSTWRRTAGTKAGPRSLL